MMQPDRLMEVKSKESHIVHCPYYPMVNYCLNNGLFQLLTIQGGGRTSQGVPKSQGLHKNKAGISKMRSKIIT